MKLSIWNSILHMYFCLATGGYFRLFKNTKIVMGNFMNDKLNDFKVTERQSFIKFLDLLCKDFLDNPESWENKTLPDFLEALSAYTKDIQGYYDNRKLKVNADEPDWSTFADIFKGAKIYE